MGLVQSFTASSGKANLSKLLAFSLKIANQKRNKNKCNHQIALIDDSELTSVIQFR